MIDRASMNPMLPEWVVTMKSHAPDSPHPAEHTPDDSMLVWKVVDMDEKDSIVLIEVSLRAPGIKLDCCDWFGFSDVMDFHKSLTEFKNRKIDECGMVGFESLLNCRFSRVRGERFSGNCLSLSFKSLVPCATPFVARMEGVGLWDEQEFTPLLQVLGEVAAVMKKLHPG